MQLRGLQGGERPYLAEPRPGGMNNPDVASFCTSERVVFLRPAWSIARVVSVIMAIPVTQLHRLLTPGTVRVGLPGHSKEDVIDALLDLLADHPAVVDPEAMRQAVFQREQVMSTGVGKGLGLPHAKTPAVRETLAAFATTAHSIDFGAIDNQPVHLVFLLIGTEQAKSEHIKILSRVSRLLNRDAFRKELLQAKNPAEVLALLEEGETQLVGH